MALINNCILIIFIGALFYSGSLVFAMLCGSKEETLENVLAKALFGIMVSSWTIYSLAVLLSSITKDIYIAVCFYTIFIVSIALFRIPRHQKWKPMSLSKTTLGTIILSFGFSWYIMAKSFAQGSSSLFLIGSNEVFDFGHAIGIIQSFALGNNIPYESPFVSGTSHIYHFLFHFFVAIFIRFGVPFVFAVNTVSAIGFTLFLLVVYSFAKKVFQWNKKAALLVFPFLLFQSTLTFISFYIKYPFLKFIPAIWHNATYFFAGPFDGSIITLYTTLNVFTNQRHLSYSLAFFFVIYLFIVTRELEKDWRKIIIWGILSGLLLLWHIPLSIGLFLTILLHGLFKKQFRFMIFFVIGWGSVVFLSTLPWILRLFQGEFVRYAAETSGVTQSIDFVYIVRFIIENFGLSIVYFIVGLKTLGKRSAILIPLLILSFSSFLLGLFSHDVDQKSFSVLLVLIRILAAYGFYVVLQKKRWKYLAFLSILPLFLSGIIDFMVIKNDYQYPTLEKDEMKMSIWTQTHTKPDAVFISYQDMHDPVVFAGRRNYYGFFHQPGMYRPKESLTRPKRVSEIYESASVEELMKNLQNTKVAFVVIPKTKRPDFNYGINDQVFRKLPIVYEDSTHFIVSVQSKHE